MTDVLLPGVLHALDLAVIERLPTAAFLPVTPLPAWLASAFEAGANAPFHSLAEALPFLDGFLPEAETTWRTGHPTVARSDAFVAAFKGTDILLRAVALTVDDRAVLVIERLTGIADPRSVIQKAREDRLDRERLVALLATMRPQESAMAHTVDQLSRTSLDDEQRAAVERLRTALDAVRSTLEALPSPPVRTRRGGSS